MVSYLETYLNDNWQVWSMKGVIKLIIILAVICPLFSTALALEFNGTVYDIEGNALNNTLINITVRDGMFNIIAYNSTTTNSTGWFNLILEDNNNIFFEVDITQTNVTFGHVQWVGQSLPSFPYDMIGQLSGTKFYLREAGTINITAINSSGDRIAFNFQIKDKALGYPVAENLGFDATMTSEAVVVVPKDRNYSIMVFPNQSMPVSFDWSNFSSSLYID